MNTPHTDQPRVVTSIPVGAKPLAVAVDVHRRVFVTNSGADTVSVIDSSTNTVSATLDVGSRPEGVATDPQFGTCVSNGGDNTVSMLDKSHHLVATVSVEGLFFGPSPPVMRVAVDHQLARAYVTHRGSSRVSAIGIGGQLPPFAPPFSEVPGALGVAVDPVSHRVFVTQPELNTVSVIDPATGGVLAAIPVRPQPTGIAIDGPRHRVYVADSGVPTVSVIDTAAGGVTEVDVGERPVGIAVDSRGDAYVTHVDGTVRVIDAGSGSVNATLPVGAQPEGLAFEPHSNRLYVANSGEGTVSVIDLAAGEGGPPQGTALTSRATGP
ncbi:YncE family protein [Streptomyces sp. NPDC005409]|uniref:YncE family protein n=1 Tax=Streptomyces sp. NPDC005409 TaxID=3155342 RepID=UPI003454452A